MRAVISSRAAWLLVGPALAAIVAFFFVPAVASVALSLTDFDIYALGDRSNLRLIGLDNYARLGRDPMFWKALGNTAVFTAVAAPLSILASLGAALLVQSSLTRARLFFRTALFLPVVATLVATAVVWRYLYHPRLGLLNAALGAIGIGPIDWLGDPRWAMPAIILMSVWKGFGFNMVVFLAALQAIPTRLYEAASIDGAGAWQSFRHVTLPMLLPALTFVGLMTLIGHLQLFAEPYVMTQGGPAGATLSIVLLTYLEGFRWWNLGYAAALSFTLFAIILVLTVIATRARALAGGANDAESDGQEEPATAARAIPARSAA